LGGGVGRKGVVEESMVRRTVYDAELKKHWDRKKTPEKETETHSHDSGPDYSARAGKKSGCRWQREKETVINENMRAPLPEGGGIRPGESLLGFEGP